MTNNNSKVIDPSFPKKVPNTYGSKFIEPSFSKKVSNPYLSKVQRNKSLIPRNLSNRERKVSNIVSFSSINKSSNNNINCEETNTKYSNDVEATCLICYSIDNNMSEKFKCSHKVCNECFKKQLDKSKFLTCCLCRSDIDHNKLENSEKELIKERLDKITNSIQNNVTEILVAMNGIDGSSNTGDFPDIYPAWINYEIGNSSPILNHF